MKGSSVIKPSLKTYMNVCDELKEKHQVDVHVDLCRKKFKTLGDRFRIEKARGPASAWAHRFDMAILKGEPQVFGSRPKTVGMKNDEEKENNDALPQSDGIILVKFYNKALSDFRKGIVYVISFLIMC